MIQERLQLGVVSFFRQRFVRSMEDFEYFQRSNLLRLINANSDTWFGSQHQFSRLRSVDDYRSAVPLSDYADLVKSVDRIIAGEQRVLSAQPVTYLQATSGTTTSHQKLIPSTGQYQRKVWHSILASQGYLMRWAQKHDIPYGQGLMLSGSFPAGKTEKGITYGSVTSNHSAIARHLWNWISVVPFEVTQVLDAETRRYLHWRFALRAKRLSYVGTTYPLPLLVFASTLFQSSDKLIRDVATGSLNHELILSSEQRHNLEKRLRPQPELATQLDKLAQRDGGLRPRSVWPDLGWLYTVNGPTYQSYDRQLRECYGPSFVWGMPYLAAEGIIGIPIEADSYAHLPSSDSTFLEFIPEQSWHEDQPRTKLLSELQTGRRYEVVLSGWNGLYRYRLEDVIEAGSCEYDIPSLQVVSRRGNVLSVVSEKMTEALIVSAVARCSQELQLTFQDFVVDIDNTVLPARYRLWAEANLEQASVNQIQVVWDHSMRSVNLWYGTLRDNGEIGPPIAILLQAGAFERYRRHRESRGMPSEQIKILHSMGECQDFVQSVTSM